MLVSAKDDTQSNELKKAWEVYLDDADQAKLLKVVEKYIPEDLDPDYEMSDEECMKIMRAPYMATHRICDIELCGKSFRVTRTSDELETLTITPYAYPSFDEAGVPYSLTGEKLQQYIKGKRQQLLDECARDAALDAPAPIPICGSIVRLMQEDKQSDCFGEIVIESKALEDYLIGVDSHLSPLDEILKWVVNRDDSIHHQVIVPKAWQYSFQYIANDLLRNGNAKVWCTECHWTYLISNLKENDDPLQQGWMYDRLFCPKDHKLLDVQVEHTSMVEENND